MELARDGEFVNELPNGSLKKSSARAFGVQRSAFNVQCSTFGVRRRTVRYSLGQGINNCGGLSLENASQMRQFPDNAHTPPRRHIFPGMDLATAVGGNFKKTAGSDFQ
jgi:hypothetical protein